MSAAVNIWQSFLQLLETQYADDISVGEICAGAGVHRSTFYRHFQDIFDLVDFGIGHETEEAVSRQDTAADIRLWQDFMLPRRTALRHLVTLRHNHRFRLAVCRSLEKQIVRRFQTAAYISPLPPEVMARFYAGGVVHAVMLWLIAPPSDSPDAETFRRQLELFREQTMRMCLRAAPD